MIRIAGQVDADRTRMIKKIGRAMREARCLSLLSHPNVIRYYSCWMEYTSPEAHDSPKPVEFATPKTPVFGVAIKPGCEFLVDVNGISGLEDIGRFEVDSPYC